jgi:hypothetical protein
MDEAEILVDEVQRGVAREVTHLAGIGLVHAGKDLHESRLARPVVADEREDLTRADVDRDAVERKVRAEALRQSLDRDERLRRPAGWAGRPRVGRHAGAGHRDLPGAGRASPRSTATGAEVKVW